MSTQLFDNLGVIVTRCANGTANGGGSRFEVMVRSEMVVCRDEREMLVLANALLIAWGRHRDVAGVEDLAAGLAKIVLDLAPAEDDG